MALPLGRAPVPFSGAAETVRIAGVTSGRRTAERISYIPHSTWKRCAVTQTSDPSVVPDDLLAKIPPIVDLDAHVVEPPDVWTSRLPARYRELGPRIVYAPAPDSIELDGASL
jgi:hypothetical protein